MTIETPAAGMPTLPAAGTNGRPSVDWMTDALCAQIGPDLWFPETGSTAAADRICARCPVRLDCLQHVNTLEGVTPGRRYGTWAGRSGLSRTTSSAPVTGDPVRDARILRLAAQGLLVGEIAQQTSYNERTVHRVLARAREAS